MGAFIYLLLMLLFVVPPEVSVAASFMPRFIGYAGDLTVEGGYDFIETKNDSFRSYTRTEMLRQSLNLATAGYVYHPNLLFFQLEGSGYYEQERNSGVSTVRYDSSNSTFSLEGKIFQKKPLNVDFYAHQERPFLVNSDRQDRVESLDRTGISLNYRKQGLLSTLKYARQDEKRSNSKNRTDDYDAYVSYYTEKMSFMEKVNMSAWGLHQERKQNTDSTFDNLSLTGNFKYKMLDVSNSFNYRENDSANEISELYGVNSSVRAKLPWDFTSVMRYRLSRSDTERFNVNTGTKFTSNDVDYYDFVLTQKLFDSLVTTMRADLSKNRSSGASSEVKKYSVDTRYRKNLPLDSQLEAGLGTNTTWVDRENLPIDDRRIIATVGGVVDGAFFLDSETDRNAPIFVWVLNEKKSGCAKGEVSNSAAECWILMTEDDHYTVGSDSIIEITVSGGFYDDLPEMVDADDYPDPHPFTFKTSYYTVAADVKTDRNDFFVNLNLFGYITGDYFHSVLRQDYDEIAKNARDTSGLSPKTTEDSVGVSVSNGPFWGRAGYQILDSSGLDNVTDAEEISTQEIYELSATYKRDNIPTGFKFVSAGLAMDYSFRDISQEYAGGKTSDDTNTRASYDLGVLATVPRVFVVVGFNSSYEYMRGDTEIVNISSGDYTSRKTPQTGLEDRDIFYNAFTVKRKFKEPRTKIATSIWAKGSWERTTGSEDTFLERYEYGLRANRAWVFGRTTFSLNARYKVVDTIENNYETSTETDRIKTDTRIMLKMVRTLF